MADSITKAEIIKPENLVYKKTSLLTDKALSYCPGCGHGTAHRIIMEVIDEMGLQSKTIGVAPVGCSVLAYEFMNIDMQQALMDVLLLLQQPLNDFIPIKLFSLTRAMAILQPSELLKPFMPATGEKISPSFLSTMAFME